MPRKKVKTHNASEHLSPHSRGTVLTIKCDYHLLARAVEPVVWVVIEMRAVLDNLLIRTVTDQLLTACTEGADHDE